MDIIKAYATKNLCYKASKKMVPKGIVVHSTGANNPNLKRYVDCESEVGKNIYGNHWNVAAPGGKKVCVHAFIGYDKDKKVRVAEILPLDICCWGVGNGREGSYNFDPPYLQFEICEDDLKNKEYYMQAFDLAARYCAYLCETYDLSVDNIVSHKEAHQKGFATNHGDPEHWMKRFGDSMNDFRNRVSKLLSNERDKESPPEKTEKKVLKDGDLVSIAVGAVYYNGGAVPDWVRSQNWYVKGSPKGDRVVIDENEKQTRSICSPIKAKYLTAVSKSNDKITPYLVRVTAASLNIRKGAGTDTEAVGCITDKGIYTIVEVKSGVGAALWGKLKSGAGWISLDYTKKC